MSTDIPRESTNSTQRGLSGKRGLADSSACTTRAAREARDSVDSPDLPAPNSPPLGLALLMARYVDGDAAAFEALHRALTPSIRRQIGGKVHDRSAVEDLLQVTFLKAHLARERFCAGNQDNEDRAVATWYSAIARNATTDYLRRCARARVAVVNTHDDNEIWSDKVPDPVGSVEARWIEEQDRSLALAWLRDALLRLPPAQREVIELHRLAELPMSEVAQRQGAKVGTVRVRAHRAYAGLASMAEHWRGPSKKAPGVH